jgi:thiamine biosynthesis lipoprotein
MLEPLVHLDGVHAVGLSVGGDMQVFTAAGSDWVWRVGISNPLNPKQVAATVEVVDGAVATSGAAERGAHILDPRTGATATSVAGATVVADRLSTADLWATTAVVAGFDDLSWIAAPGIRSGLVISPAGAVRRWAQGVEITRWKGSTAVAS